MLLLVIGLGLVLGLMAGVLAEGFQETTDVPDGIAILFGLVVIFLGVGVAHMLFF